MQASLRWPLLVAVLGAAALVPLFSGCRGASEGNAASETQLQTVRRGDLVLSITTTGNLSLPRQAHLSFLTSGTVEQVLVEVAQRVQEGQALARLDDSSLKLAVLDAQGALNQVQKALADYLKKFTPEEMEKAKDGVAGAQTSVLQAQMVLKTYQDGFTHGEIAKAASVVGTAQAGLLQAEQAREDFLSTFALQAKTKAEAAVANATLALQDAEKALDTARSPVPGNPVYDARERLRSTKAETRNAQVGLDAANADLQVAQEDWALKETQAQRVVTAAENAYQAQLIRPHGISLNTPELLLRSPQALLPHLIIIPSSVQSAWDSLEDARQSLSIVRLQEQRVIAVAQNSVVKAREALVAAQQAQVQAADALQAAQAADSQRIRAKELALELAKATLDKAEADLPRVIAGPDPVQLGSLQAAVDAAKTRVQEAQKTLADLKAGPASDELAIRQAAVDSAKARTRDAQRALAELETGPDPLEKTRLETAVASATLRLQQAQQNLERAWLKAPFSGVASAVNITAGDVVGAAAVAVVLVDTKSAEVTASVDEIDLAGLRTGQRAVVTSEATPDLRLPGTVKSIAPVARVQQGVVSYDIVIALGPAVPESLRGGMTMNATIVAENRPNVLLVPLRAVQTSGRERTVQVMENGVQVKRAVRLGVSNAQFAEVLEGLAEGDQVVVPARAAAPSSQPFRFPGGGFGGGGLPGGGVRPPGR